MAIATCSSALNDRALCTSIALTMVRRAYVQAPSELVDLRWDQIDFTHAVLHVRRAKKGSPATHPVVGDEMRPLRRLQREQDPSRRIVFTSERGSPFTTAGFARMVERAGVEAKLGFPAHPHMLRHACGFALANKGHDTLGEGKRGAKACFSLSVQSAIASN